MKKYKMFTALFTLIVCVLLLTACGSETTEKEEMAVDSLAPVTIAVEEPGIFGYESLTREHYKASEREGDIGTIVLRLLSDSEEIPSYYETSWWNDWATPNCLTDVIVIAEQPGTVYYGRIRCPKCCYEAEVEEVIGTISTVKSFGCNCNPISENPHIGIRKVLNIVVVPLKNSIKAQDALR